MGKAEEEQPLPIAGEGELRAHQNAENRRCCWRISERVSFRCVFALLLGVGVLLSALFLLPFFHRGDPEDRGLDSRFGGTFLDVLLLNFSVFWEFRRISLEILFLLLIWLNGYQLNLEFGSSYILLFLSVWNFCEN